ncbi:hypothetical protein ABEG63_16050 [Chryseobacterium sp. C39-AII1]|uniref:hypothetical protein n=1 Tax=Chryseobacterium sp. C39-AII1 TaxID=3080332 RepID=UPI0032090922
MKYLFVGLICGLFLMNCQNKEGTVSKESSGSNLDTIEINKLPFGNELLIKKFINNDELGFLDDSETKLLEFEDSSFLSYYEKFFKNSSLPIDKFYKYKQKNILDFGLNYIEPIDSINTYKGYYSLAKRLPDIGKNNIFIMNSNMKNGEFLNISNCIDLVVYNREKGIINNLNLAFYLSATDERYYNFFGDIHKYFYIDSNYTIHIKYFAVNNDSNSSLLIYTKYKIQQDGIIVRYFEQENTNYKSEFEEGIIKNHLKEGVWKETLSNTHTNYCIKNYKNGITTGNVEIVNIDDNGKKSSFFIDKNSYLPLKN